MTTGYRNGFEGPFEDWLRKKKELDSVVQRLSISNSDFWIHQYRSHHDRVGDRTVDNIMLVEVKTEGADIPFAQRDTLILVNQLLRRSSDNRYKILKDMKGGRRLVQCFGVHLLQLSSDRPDNSAVIRWDRTVVDEDTLVRVIRFELNPYTLEPRSERRHHTLPRINLPLLDLDSEESA